MVDIAIYIYIYIYVCIHISALAASRKFARLNKNGTHVFRTSNNIFLKFGFITSYFLGLPSYDTLILLHFTQTHTPSLSLSLFLSLSHTSIHT